MSIATGTGDAGDSGLIGGARVPKDNSRLEAYGSLDELNAAIGVAISHGLPTPVEEQLEQVSHWLFDLGSDLASPRAGLEPGQPLRVGEEHHVRLTEWIHATEETLPPLRNFILPGGSPGAAALHLARTICRRAERRLVSFLHDTGEGSHGVVFLNRLSDLLFLQARVTNIAASCEDVVWRAAKLDSDR